MTMAALARGKIVWAELLDPQGRNPKERPAVVLTADDDIKPGGEIWVAAVTGEIRAIPAEFAVRLPWHRSGHPETKLTKPCAVACHWLGRIPVAAISKVKGQVPPRHMAEMLAAVALVPGTPFPAPPVAGDSMESGTTSEPSG
jgi:mRNA-degrading endonuclease toxin of MazEF toxin-antitoxin module